MPRCKEETHLIFFAGNDGTILKGIPEAVYQGAANANTVYLIAPFAAGTQASVSFRLPDGENYPPSGPAVMREQGAIGGVVDPVTGGAFSGWVYDLPGPIAARYGKVLVQFYFTNGTGQVAATSVASFVVGQGVQAELPETPDEETYTAILARVAALQSQLDNGFYCARSVYAWNAAYTYGADELAFYAADGRRAFVRSRKSGNVGRPPYGDAGVVDAEWWEEVADIAQAASAAVSAAEASESASAFAGDAEGSAEEARQSAEEAQEYAEIAKRYAEIGIRLNADYGSVAELPAVGSPEYIYLIPAGSGAFDQYIWSSDAQAYKKIGSTAFDADGFAREDGTYPEMTEGSAPEAGSAAVAGKLTHALTIQSGDGSVTFDGSAAKTVTVGSGSAEPDGTYPEMTVGSAAVADKLAHALTVTGGDGSVVFDGSAAVTVTLSADIEWATDAEVTALFGSSLAPSVSTEENAAGGTTYSITL